MPKAKKHNYVVDCGFQLLIVAESLEYAEDLALDLIQNSSIKQLGAYLNDTLQVNLVDYLPLEGDKECPF